MYVTPDAFADGPHLVADFFAELGPLPDLDGALCAEVDPALWYPERGHEEWADQAKSICRGCPAEAACLRWALDQDEVWGVWGGTTEAQRQEMRTQGLAA